jgi:hypothetical protein
MHKAGFNKMSMNVARVIHSPTLSTVMMVEDALRAQEGPVTIEALKRALPKKVMDQSLRMILAYLENKGSIIIGSKGIEWIANDNPKFLKMIENARKVDV